MFGNQIRQSSLSQYFQIEQPNVDASWESLLASIGSPFRLKIKDAVGSKNIQVKLFLNNKYSQLTVTSAKESRAEKVFLSSARLRLPIIFT